MISGLQEIWKRKRDHSEQPDMFLRVIHLDTRAEDSIGYMSADNE